MPHSSCNCRCVMCDIWKANKNKQEISYETLLGHVAKFKNLNVREVVFSGGEALMHSNLWKLCELLKNNRIKITLLSTGLLLKKNAGNIIDNIDQVIVSLDGSEEVHDRIRKIPRAFAQLSEGIHELRKLRPDFPISGRCVLQRYNFSDFINIVKAAKNIGLDRISFLAADVSSNAFNRPQQWDDGRVHEIVLSEAETLEFESIVQSSFIELNQEYQTKFVAESPSKMNRIVQYYKAVNHMDSYPAVECNAPWISAVIESDGNVMPCYFHKPYGNIYQNDFSEVINSRAAIEFRKNLNTQRDDICKKCVCSLKLGITQML
ncbi:MAG: radical SAM protein [Cyclobacteriaceae bacterium]